MIESCDNCASLEVELEAARDSLSNVEYDYTDMENSYWDEQSKAEHYASKAEELLVLLKKIAEEVPHIYMFIESGTYKEFTDSIGRGLE